MLFSRIVPTVKDLGLFGLKVRKAFEAMGVIGFAETNPDDLSAADEEIARELDRNKAMEPGGGGADGPLSETDPVRAAEVAAAIELGAE
jgi:hypothetical protein